MINIRPVSDLRNKYPEIENLVLKEDEAVYLTKNGYGSMVVMSLEKYSKLLNNQGYEEYVEKSLEEAEKELDTETVERLIKSEEDIENGRTRKATEVIKELRAKYGF